MLETSTHLVPVSIIDIRCLQLPSHANRGIGAHTRGFLTRRPAGWGQVIGLIDPDWPLPAKAILDSVDDLRTTAYFPGLPAGSLFINPSPMTYDPLFLARLLTNPALRKVAVVYDFIPFDDKPRYLRAPGPRLTYYSALAWLKKYDLFLPISDSAQQRLNALLGAPLSIVTGVPLPHWAGRGENARPLHILAVAGNDSRKNPEIVIRAHAASAVLQARRIPLIITGDYPEGIAAEFQALARAEGGDPGLLTVPGHVTDEVLRGWYQNAICVATASRAEGFSLPVVEAMAAGVPSIVSDIPPHAALVTDPALRFHPDDRDRLRALLERIVGSAETRAGIVAAQSRVWPNFEPKAVAAKIWDAIASVADTPPRVAVSRGARPRVALLTPLPPSRSGVADYSAALVGSLRRHVHLDLFAPESGAPVEGIEIGPVSALPHLLQRYDRVISVLGNSHFHAGIFDQLKRFGGAAVCHDSRMLGFYAWKHGHAHAARMAGEELRRGVGEAELGLWLQDESKRQASLLGEIARLASPMIVHAQPVADHIRLRFKRTAKVLPFAVRRAFTADELDPRRRLALRRALALDPERVHIASFGFLHPSKGVVAALRALRLLLRAGVPAQLHWVGEPGAWSLPVRTLAARLRVDGHLTLMPRYVSEARYRAYLLAADFGLQLRTTGAGSISGALQDCISAGLPSVASAALAADLDAPDYVARVSDLLKPDEIAAALLGLIENPPQRLAAMRADYCEAHSMDRYARRLCEVLDLEV